MQDINLDYRSPNYNKRPAGKKIGLIVIHYTGMKSARVALERLCDPKAEVSAHYLIDEEGQIFSLVDEKHRAWHAGKGGWAGETDINSISIGIEMVNPGHEFGYRPFTNAQFEAIGPLSRDILVRHNIPRHRVVGHSDIAPQRKQDPGEKFFWDRLAWQGMGLWPALDFKVKPVQVRLGLGDQGEAVVKLQDDLRQLGYHFETSETFDEELETIIVAFQRHWRPDRIDGVFDGECAVILRELLDRMGGKRH